MILSCVCGRRFRTQHESDARHRTCPQCGGALVPENDALVPAVDIDVLLEQMKVLRDELVARDRQLRQTQAELDQLRARYAQPPSAVAEPVTPPRELPSNRVPLFAFRDP